MGDDIVIVSVIVRIFDTSLATVEEMVTVSLMALTAPLTLDIESLTPTVCVGAGLCLAASLVSGEDMVIVVVIVRILFRSRGPKLSTIVILVDNVLILPTDFITASLIVAVWVSVLTEPLIRLRVVGVVVTVSVIALTAPLTLVRVEGVVVVVSVRVLN